MLADAISFCFASFTYGDSCFVLKYAKFKMHRKFKNTHKACVEGTGIFLWLLQSDRVHKKSFSHVIFRIG